MCVRACVCERQTVLAVSTVQYPVTMKLNNVTECSIVTEYCSVLAANTAIHIYIEYVLYFCSQLAKY